MEDKTFPPDSGHYMRRFGPLLCKPLGSPKSLCPNGTPEKPKRLSAKNRRAFEHFKECRAVGFTDQEKADPIVRRNARIIQDVIDAVAREEQASFTNSVLTLASTRIGV